MASLLKKACIILVLFSFSSITFADLNEQTTLPVTAPSVDQAPSATAPTLNTDSQAQNTEPQSGNEVTPSPEQEEAIASDPSLEQRLITVSIYKTKKGDTLRKVARFLYGHETWWKKLREENSQFLSFESSQPMPVGAQIQYRAPQLGTSYVVQQNDWLTRIVQWKYGATGLWEEIYKKNAEKISNPNLIHPGDVLTLALDGTVRNKESGNVLVEGVQMVAPPPTVPVTQNLPNPNSQTAQNDPSSTGMQNSQSEATGYRQPASIAEQPSSLWDYPWNFILGFAIGILGLVICSGALWLVQGSSSMSASSELADVADPSLVRRKKKKSFFKMTKRKKHEAKPSKHGDYPFAFGSRPAEEPELRKDLIHRDVGEWERVPGYELITTRRSNVKKN